MNSESPAPGIDRRNLIVGAAAGALAAGLPRAHGAPMARLEIVGPELRQNGVPLRLLGVAVGDPLYIRKDRPLSDYRVIAEVWRANTVRISLLPGHWRADRENALKALGADVAAARATGLIVIIAWHPIGFPGRYTERPDPSWGLPDNIYDTDLSLAVDFSSSVVHRPSFGRGWTSRSYSNDVSPDRSTLRTVFRDTLRSRAISLIVLPLRKCSRRIRPWMQSRRTFARPSNRRH